MEQLPVRQRRYPDSGDIVVEPQPRPLPAGYFELPPGDDGGDDWSRWLGYWDTLTRHKVSLAAAGLCGLILGVVFSVFQTPMFRASTTLEFQTQASQQQPFEGINYLNSNDPYLMQTQVQLLTSNMLQTRVQAKMRETQSAAAPTPAAAGQMSAVSWMAGLRAVLPGSSRPSGWDDALAIARSQLKVTPVKDSRIVQISTESTSPQVAADYVNTVVSEFISQSQDDRWTLYQSTTAWLTRAQQDLKAQLEESERQLLAYASESGLVGTSKDDNIVGQKLVQLQAEASRAQAERIAKESSYRTAMAQPTDSLATALDNGPSDTKLTDLRRELADLNTMLTPEHPRVKRLEAQIAVMEASKQSEGTALLARLRRDYESALYRERQLVAELNTQAGALSSQDKKLIRYKMLQREVDTYRSLYDTTLQKGKEASVASALRPVSARMIDSARPARLPYKPSVPTNLGLGLLAGLGLGIGLVIHRDRTDASIRVPGSIPVYLNVRELGVIPSAGAEPDLLQIGGPKRAKSLRMSVLSSGRRPELPDVTADLVELMTWNRKSSAMAESFRATLTSLLTTGTSREERRVVLVTSPSPQEGKSTVITNLAIALAEIDQRVLLIDADLRRPRLHAVLNQANTWGLSDLLRETTPCEDYPAEALCRKTHVPRLSFLPSGPGSVNVSKLLYSSRMDDLLARLRNEFDAVLIDTPPVLRVADARILSRLADAVVLVFRAGVTTRESAALALNTFAADRVPVLGAILNDWNPRTMGHGYYGGLYGEGYKDASNL